jgi:hypothetical protein
MSFPYMADSGTNWHYMARRITAENLPGHLHVTVGRNIQRGRRRGLFERQAERPAAEHIPVRDARQTRELD